MLEKLEHWGKSSEKFIGLDVLYPIMLGDSKNIWSILYTPMIVLPTRVYYTKWGYFVEIESYD